VFTLSDIHPFRALGSEGVNWIDKGRIKARKQLSQSIGVFGVDSMI